MSQSDQIAKILRERRRQDDKWGADRNLFNESWLTILSEEVGEAAKAILETDFENLDKEVMQVAAVALAWLENLERRKMGP